MHATRSVSRVRPGAARREASDGAARATRALRALERARDRYGAGCAAAKLEALRSLARGRLRTAAAIARLHEALCFLRAYPDDAAVLAQVERMLARFHRRGDLRQHRAALADSGIAGTAIHYRFFWATALWFARRWPGLLRLDRDSAETGEKIAAALPSLLTPAEAAALRHLALPGYAAIDRLRRKAGGGASDAAFWVRLIEAMPGDTFTRQDFHDRIDAAYVLRPSEDTPSRTHAWCAGAPASFQTVALRRERPDLRAEIGRPPRAVRPVAASEGANIVDLARAAMVTRARDLEAFAYGDPRDVRVVDDDGAGLAFAVIGTQPERRTLIPGIYGYLALRNRVPVGYGEIFPIGRHASITFNIFETFRGGEAAHILARMLAMAHHLFGVATYSLEPYQVGHDNDEAIGSGAWWFYYKLGFRPLAAEARRVLREELQRLAGDPAHRSSVATLRRLARGPMAFDHDPGRRLRQPPLAAIGLKVADLLAARERIHGGRAPAIASCVEDAMQLTGATSRRGMAAAERLAWQRWSPLLLSIPGVSHWSAADRAALAALIRAKAGPREGGYVAAFAAHPRLPQALLGEPSRRDFRPGAS